MLSIVGHLPAVDPVHSIVPEKKQKQKNAKKRKKLTHTNTDRDSIITDSVASLYKQKGKNKNVIIQQKQKNTVFVTL